jgi:hypothetical protein
MVRVYKKHQIHREVGDRLAPVSDQIHLADTLR